MGLREAQTHHYINVLDPPSSTREEECFGLTTHWAWKSEELKNPALKIRLKGHFLRVLGRMMERRNHNNKIRSNGLV